jgi:acyl dehydratase
MVQQASLIPPESAAQVGTVVGEPRTAVITARDSQRYAHAVDDLDPIYFDEDAARDAGYDGLVAPPTFVSHVVVDTQPLSALRPDGLFRSVQRLDLAVQRVMFGGEEWDFLEPAYVGDRITAETRLVGLDQKTGSGGPFVRITNETTYTNQHGVVVARSRQIGIAR